MASTDPRIRVSGGGDRRGARKAISLPLRPSRVESCAKGYVARLQAALDALDLRMLERMVGVLATAREEGKKIFVCGNGGSAALASHLACDLNKTCSVGGRKFRAMALTDSMPLMSAWANDSGYDDVFKNQLSNFVSRGDVLIAISSSGNSANVVAAVQLAREHAALTLGLLGFGGGDLREQVDYALCLDESDYGIVEDAHAVVCHLLTNSLLRVG